MLMSLAIRREKRLIRPRGGQLQPAGRTRGDGAGLYEEARDEVNPFLYHYTRNRHEEVEKVLRKSVEK